MMVEWLLIVVLASGDAYELIVPMSACMDTPMQIRAGEPVAVRMSDGSLRDVIGAACMGPAGESPSTGLGS